MRLLPELERRAGDAGHWRYTTVFVALALTVLAGTIMFSLLGHPPLKALYVFFVKPLSTFNGLAELGVKATPLVLCAIGLALCFRANVWNIGAEGQLTLGALAASWFAITWYETESLMLLPVMIIAGIIGGMLWAFIPALLKTRFNANEILTSLMLVYVAQLLLAYLVHGPWKDPDGFSFPESRLFPDASAVPRILPGTRLHAGALFALASVAAAWLMLGKSLPGYRIRVTGSAPSAARYAGFSAAGVVWLVLGISGGLAGLAGMLEVAGPIGQLVPTISPGYGFSAIIVAFLGRLHPVGILFAGLALALSFIGGELLQIEMGLPLAVTLVFQGMLLFFLLGSDVLLNYRLVWRKGNAEGARPETAHGGGS